jgi:crotonobetainyl-CoA:carnitine CoA-transferase CaiB-like acyl-CoA transferase
MKHAEEGAALANLVVIDFSQGVAGPHIGMLLARQGADVVKVEPPQGDWSRVLGTQHGDSSAYSLNFNLGKRSIALDLKTREGLEVARDLIARADVVIEAFRPGVMRKLGLHYEAVAESNARVVYVSVSGYGQQGPRSSLPVTDGVIQGDSGLMALNRSREKTPQRFPMVVVDVVTGIYGAQAVLAALLRRERTGRGAYIDCPLMQSALALQAPAILEHQFEHGSPDVLYVPLGVLKTSDGHMSLAVRTEIHFASLCDVLDRPDLKTDVRFSSRLARVRHEEILMTELSRTFATRTSREWYEVGRLLQLDAFQRRQRSYPGAEHSRVRLRHGVERQPRRRRTHT